MTAPRVSARDIINEVMEIFPNKASRSVKKLNSKNEGSAKEGCYYKSGSKRCAVGYFMHADAEPIRNPQDFEEVAINGSIGSCASPPVKLEDCLVATYRGHSPMFWRELQMWHDNPKHFNEGGWTDEGAAVIKHIKKVWT